MVSTETKLITWILLSVLIKPNLISAQEEIYQLSYEEFDQTPSLGWRSLAEKRNYLEAGKLIDKYIERNINLEKWQIINLSFHAGQMYAYSGKNNIAILRLKNSIIENESVDSPIRWNAYVEATIAFLENDEKKLIEMRDEIAAGNEFQGRIENLDVVNKLITEFSQPYSEAYGSR